MKKKIYKDRRKYVGILLQIERECLKLDQKDIAQMLGVRQEWISKIEVGTRRLDVIELIDYCEALNLTLTEFAAKIESRLFAERLLPRRRRQIKDSGETKKIRVDVSWCENKFSASLGVNVPGIGVFTADTFVDLQIDVEASLAFHIERLVANGNEVPQWLVNKEYEFEYRFLDAQSLLNAYRPYISLAAISRVSGINQNLLSQYANGLKTTRPYQLKRIMDAIHQIGNELTSAVV